MIIYGLIAVQAGASSYTRKRAAWDAARLGRLVRLTIRFNANTGQIERAHFLTNRAYSTSQALKQHTNWLYLGNRSQSDLFWDPLLASSSKFRPVSTFPARPPSNPLTRTPLLFPKTPKTNISWLAALHHPTLAPLTTPLLNSNHPALPSIPMRVSSVG